MSAGAVRAGGVFVEIGADPRKFFSALNKVNKSLASMGGALVSGGGRLAAAGVGMAAPIVAAVRQGTAFESTLLNIRASTGATAAEIDKIKASAMDMSRALGVGPTEAAGGMLELLKAGMSLDAVLGGAGKTALEFAKVGEMEVGQAAVVMSDAMNVFKVSSDVAANALSSAADASSTSIAQMAEAFSMSSAVAGLANQSIGDLSAALAILANNGVKGSDAGTSVKTMLMRLMAPADDAVGALTQLGLTVGSFRGADGQMLPMVDIIRLLNDEMQGLDQTAKDDIFRRLFGADAIRAASILASAGVEGFTSMQDAMASALPVGEKYKLLMSGLAGAGGNILAAMQRLSIAIAGAVTPALAGVVPFITGFINGLTDFATKNAEAVAGFAKMAVGAIAVGSAITGLGMSFQVFAFSLGGIGKALTLVVSPMRLVGDMANVVFISFRNVTGQLGRFSIKGIGSVLGFATQSGVAMARASAGFGTLAVDAIASAVKIASAMGGTALAGVLRFAQLGVAAVAQFSAKSTALIAVSAAQSGATTASYFAGTISIVSASVARAVEGNMQAAAIGVKAFRMLGVAGATNALIAQQSMLRLAAQGGSGLLRLGAQGSTALATIGSTAISVGASTTGALAKAGTTSGGSLARLATTGTSGLMRIGSAAVSASRATIGSLIKAAAVGVAQAGAMSLAWLGGLARMTAVSAVSGVAMAASFLAPFAAIAAAVVGVGALFYAFKDQIFAAIAPIGDMVSQAGGAIGSGFSTAISDAMVVFGDLASTATTTFTGIYDAIAAGDLSGAMDILWAGLNAGWLRGVEALMSYVDPWIATFQDAFTIMGAEIYKGWDALWVSVGSALNTAGAYLMGAFDNIINPILAMWDTLEAGILKSWNYIQSFFKKGFDLKKENEKVDNKMDARKRKRELERPGIAGRVDKATKENTAAEAEMIRRRDAVDAGTQETIAGRETANAQRAADRRAATVAAEGALSSLVSGKTETRAKNSQVDDLLASIKGATSVDQLAGAGGLGDQFSTLRDLGRLTSEQEGMLSDALDKAAEGLTGTAEAGANAAGDQSKQSMGAVAGTFSSLNLGQVFGGSSLAERTAKAVEETAKNTRKIDDGGKVAA